MVGLPYRLHQPIMTSDLGISLPSLASQKHRTTGPPGHQTTAILPLQLECFNRRVLTDPHDTDVYHAKTYRIVPYGNSRYHQPRHWRPARDFTGDFFLLALSHAVDPPLLLHPSRFYSGNANEFSDFFSPCVGIEVLLENHLLVLLFVFNSTFLYLFFRV